MGARGLPGLRLKQRGENRMCREMGTDKPRETESGYKDRGRETVIRREVRLVWNWALT